MEDDTGSPRATINEDTRDTISNFDEDLRELKYQYRSFPVRMFMIHVWPRVHYFWWHLAYIVSLTIFGGVIVWGLEKTNTYYSNSNRTPLTYIDAALSAASASTSCSLATLEFWALRRSTQIVHIILSTLANSVFVAAITALLRRKSLSAWLSKHPQRGSREGDNVVLCHEALRRLGVTLLLFNLLTVLIGWALLASYTNTVLKNELKPHVDPTFFAFFTVVSSVNQTGFSLLESGLISFNHHTFLAFLLSFIMLISNMFAPVVIRFLISVAARFSRDPEPWRFLLEHPRICSTILFPALQTRILAWCVTAFFTLQVTTFALLDFMYPVLSGMSGWHRFVVSIFQAANNMQTGFPVVQVEETNSAQQWCYFIFMLVAVYPYVSMLRNTEVNKEGHDFFHPDSLLKQKEDNEEFEKQLQSGNKIGQWCIFSMWKVIFEVASAYGGVGLSLGYPEIASAFSQIFSQKAKVVMIFVLILGRHRELPRQRDVAVMQVEILAKSS